MEIKVQCDCGQKFKFDVEPVNGRMPWEVNCPVCGASGTDKANWIIAHAAPAPMSAPLAPIGSVGSTPLAGTPLSPPPAAAAPVAVPLPAAEPPKPRLAIRQHAPAPAAPAVAQPAVPRPVPMRSVPVAEKAAPSTNTLFFRGVLGAFVGALIGMGIWYGLAVATEHQFGIVAWGVGALTGLGARLMAREGNTALGIVSALFAAVAILMGGTLAVHHMLVADPEFAALAHGSSSHELYTDSVKEAKEAGPLETDAQIKAYLAKREGGNESDIAPEEIDAFKKDELPEMKELASGSLTEEAYKTRHHKETAAVSGIASVAGWVGAFIASIFSLWTILWLLFGCASAYKLGADVD